MSELRAIAQRLGPDATKEQLHEALKYNKQARHELLDMFQEAQALAANQILRQRLDDDPLLALTILEKIGWAQS
jgi:hypothetical protein